MSRSFKQTLVLLVGRPVHFLLYPFISLYLNKNARAKIVVQFDEKILFVRYWMDNGEWDLPGGGLHKKEKPIKGAIRELREEVGISLSQSHVRELGQRKYKSGLKNYDMHGFHALLSKEPILQLQTVEIFKAQWFTKSQIAKLKINENIRQMLNEIGY